MIHSSGPAGPTVRPITEADRPFFQRIVGCLDPGPTVSPRDPAALADSVRRLGAGEIEEPAGAETLVAVDAAGAPLGPIALRRAADSFTGHDRASYDPLGYRPDHVRWTKRLAD